MKVYIIKRKGKTWWGNFVGIANPLMTTEGEEINIPSAFFRAKDAKKYLSSFHYSDSFEIVSAEIKQSSQDNRRH